MINPGLVLIGLLGSGPCITVNWPSFTGIGPGKSIFSSPSLLNFFISCVLFILSLLLWEVIRVKMTGGKRFVLQKRDSNIAISTKMNESHPSN